MTEFTPIQSFLGGSLIGLAAVLLMAVHGRIAGITGILGGLLPPAPAKDWQWRAAFIVGMVAAPALYMIFMGRPSFASPAGTVALIVGGVLAGIGVTFGAGCTSGHGVCGLSRLSPRSFAAVATFMATAAATVYIMRHVVGG